jgi:hypothetical protein
MRAAALIVPVAGMLALWPAEGRADTASDTSTARPQARTSPAPRAHRKLKLGPFADPYARIDDAALAELLRFYQHVEVEGKAPQELEVAMAAWWDHFNFQHAVYGHGYNIQEPVVPGAVNILPLIDWLKKKVKDSRRNKRAAEAIEAEENP